MDKISPEIFEEKVLKRIYDGKDVESLWRRKTNEQLIENCREPSVTDMERAQRIKLLTWEG